MTRPGHSPFFWIPALVASAWWVISAGAFGFLTWFGLVPTAVVKHLVPETIPSNVWFWSWPWVGLAPLASAAGVFVVYLVLARLIVDRTDGSRAARFFALWFVAVLTGFLATLPWVISAIISAFPPSRAAFVLDPAGESLLLSGYWGIAWGWLPAVLALRRVRVPASATGSTADAAPAPVATGPFRRHPLAVLGGITVAVLVLSGLGAGFGSRAERLHAAAENALADGNTLGAVPDPDAQVTPPPSVAPDAAVAPVGWCTKEDTAVLLGDPDAATGHRTVSIQAMNFSDVPCTLNGYPDLAFADQAGSYLAVTLVHGGSFMTTDDGPHPIEVPAGGFAITRLGWDAMATADVPVTYTLYAALYPGLDRGSWPSTLDIVAGGEVSVTAWSLTGASD
ncbi:DUF4232 domain-containing protein [Cryobacterium sp. GrIS_2_6]|uniref:DUF4232 domain-containing protein n=1 Tax=Cryobacterium sp. GrIS_2_6 TaxID=3162785 RepID=UPI002DFB7B33|nr:hypothetical protein [Cryobacterium psychrotolerans]